MSGKRWRAWYELVQLVADSPGREVGHVESKARDLARMSAVLDPDGYDGLIEAHALLMAHSAGEPGLPDLPGLDGWLP